MTRHALLGLVALALVAVALLGCGGAQEYAIVGTARAAGADGTIEVEQIEGGNRLVRVSMAHLPPPGRLGEGLNKYVVWFVPEGKQPVKAGALGYDEESREGRMMATSPMSVGFNVKITAEKSANVAAPNDVVVAQRKVK